MIIRGVYKITNPKGKIYIGQSIDIERRKLQYKRCNSDIKGQIKLYNSLVKYGWEQHKFEVLEECYEEKLLETETYWKHYYKVLEIPSLCCKIDGRGGKHSEETKNNIRLGNIGQKRSKETCENIRQSVIGKPKPGSGPKKGRIVYWNVGRKSKKVVQKDKEKNIIKIWDNVKQVKEQLNINIYDALEKNNNTAGGFIWDWF